MERKVFNGMQDKIIARGKKPTFWLLLIAIIIVFAGVCFYRDLLIHYTCLAIRCFFKSPEDTRNVIYLFAAVIGACLLYWRTKIAEREANISQQNFKTTEQNIKITEQNIKTIEQKMIYERITQAAEQLISKNASTRLIGISDLEKIAKEHEDECRKITQILSTYIRELAPRDLEKENQISSGILASKNTQRLLGIWLPFIKREKHHQDIENVIKALSSIGRMYPDEKPIICNLSGTDLSGLSSFVYDLTNFSISQTNLTSANLSFVNFNGADISGSNLNGANFNSANLTAVDFKWSNFEDTRLNGANISNADFGCVQGLTQKQIQEAFCWEGEPPRNLPNGLNPPPMREKPKEEASTDILPPPPLPPR